MLPPLGWHKRPQRNNCPAYTPGIRLSRFLFHFESVLQIRIGCVGTILSLNPTHPPILGIYFLNSCNEAWQRGLLGFFIISCCLVVHLLNYPSLCTKTKFCVAFIGCLVW